MNEPTDIISNNRTTEIPVNTQTRKRGRPHGSTTREAGHTSSVHLPERVRSWLKENNMRFSDYVTHACKWHDRMRELTEDLRLADKDVARLEEERNAARREIARLYEENADLLRTKARTLDRLNKGEVVFK